MFRAFAAHKVADDVAVEIKSRFPRFFFSYYCGGDYAVKHGTKRYSRRLEKIKSHAAGHGVHFVDEKFFVVAQKKIDAHDARHIEVFVYPFRDTFHVVADFVGNICGEFPFSAAVFPAGILVVERQKIVPGHGAFHFRNIYVSSVGIRRAVKFFEIFQRIFNNDFFVEFRRDFDCRFEFVFRPCLFYADTADGFTISGYSKKVET